MRDLLALLAEHNIGAVVVSADGTASTGSSASATSYASCTGDDASSTAPVERDHDRVVRTCEPGHDLDELMALMTEHRIRHVPVVDDGRLVGVVSIGDVVKSRITQLTFERDQLDSYVHQT